ncbi:uncharacterized protein LOC130102524 [Rhinichthys klamathensis goyatoka]|uniref:uncharacterized protein LOC130102524 n=1 Tax=Rhinichthys klamathensis goyatoka TaxID=3034132 RepID=UPI0024B566DB|nr:uncharacterized protein LOC130102524 [Rhinichthys klamathensis goyatoka]
MAEFNPPRRRRNSDCSEVSCASVRSLDHPPSFRRDGNQPVGNRSRHDATLINPGPPRLYQLNKERKHINGTEKKVRRWTYGRRDRNKQNKVILMVGETGAGKTAMINTMVNYLLGVKFEDQEFYQITEEEKQEAQSQSLTSEITVYEVFVEDNPTSLTIIDTPGIGDTEGCDREREISDDLGRLFSDEDFHCIDAVCFVMKASQNQLSGKEHYILQSVLSLYGKDIEKNIVFIITHSDGRPPTDALSAIDTAQIRCRRDEDKEPVHFLFNSQQEEKRAHAHKSSWEMGEKSMERFLKLLLENNREQTPMPVDVRKPFKQLEACVFNLIDRITEKELKIKERIEILEAIRQNRDKIEKSQNFKFSVNKTVKEKVLIEFKLLSLSNYATCCPVCEENCHQFGCWWVTFNDLSGCDVMKDGHCAVCTGRCPHRRHVKGNEKYVVKTERVEMSFDELKQKYESTGDLPETSFDQTKYKDDTRKEHEKDKKESENKTKIEENLKRDLEKIKAEKSTLLYEAYKLIMNLSKNLITTDWYFTAQHLDFFIPRLEEEEGKGKRVRDLEEVRTSLEDWENRFSQQNWVVRGTRYLSDQVLINEDGNTQAGNLFRSSERLEPEK